MSNTRNLPVSILITMDTRDKLRELKHGLGLMTHNEVIEFLLARLDDFKKVEAES
jgi:hypothetical protein